MKLKTKNRARNSCIINACRLIMIYLLITSCAVHRARSLKYKSEFLKLYVNGIGNNISSTQFYIDRNITLYSENCLSSDDKNPQKITEVIELLAGTKGLVKKIDNDTLFVKFDNSDTVGLKFCLQSPNENNYQIYTNSAKKLISHNQTYEKIVFNKKEYCIRLEDKPVRLLIKSKVANKYKPKTINITRRMSGVKK